MFSVFCSSREVVSQDLHGNFGFLKLNKTQMPTKKPCVGQEITLVSRIEPLASQCASSNKHRALLPLFRDFLL